MNSIYFVGALRPWDERLYSVYVLPQPPVETSKRAGGLLSWEKPSVPWAGGVAGRPFTVQLLLGKLLVSKGREIDFKLPQVSQQLFIKHAEQKNGVRESLFIWKNSELTQMDLSDII